MKKHLILLLLTAAFAAAQHVRPGGGIAAGGGGSGAPNIHADIAGPATSSGAIDISALNLTSTSLNGLIAKCWTGTGFSAGLVTGNLTELACAITSRSTSALTVTFALSSNVLIVINSSGGAGPAGATGPQGPQGPAGSGGGTTYAAANTWTIEVLCAPNGSAPLGTVWSGASCSGTTKTLGAAPTGMSLEILRNGQSLVQGIVGNTEDFTVSGTTVTFSTTLSSADKVIARYLIASGAVSDTELGYLDGVTSAIQTQLNGKAATSAAQPRAAATVAFSSTPVFSAANSRSEITLAGNISSCTFTNLVAGGIFSVAFLQDGTGSRTKAACTAAVNECTIAPTANIRTTQFYQVGQDGTTVHGVGCVTDHAYVIQSGPAGAAPGNPASGSLTTWFDLTDLNLKAKTAAGTVKFLVNATQCSGTDKLQGFNADGTPNCAADAGGGLADPGANGVVVRTALNTTAVAGEADIESALGSQSANLFLASPNGSAGTSDFRAIVKADLPGVTGFLDQPNNHTAGQKNTFTHNSTTAGFNIGSVASNPSSLENGDFWNNAGIIKYYDGTITKTFAALEAAQTFTAKNTFTPTASAAGLQVACAALPSSPANGDIACDSADSNKVKVRANGAWVTVESASGAEATIATRWLSTIDYTGANMSAQAIGTLNQMRVYAVQLQRKATFTTWNLYVGTAVASSNAYMALYNAACDTKISQSTAMSVASVGSVTQTVSGSTITLDPGVYYLAIALDTTIAAVNGYNNSALLTYFNAGTYAAGASAANALSGSTMPSTCGALTKSGVLHALSLVP